MILVILTVSLLLLGLGVWFSDKWCNFDLFWGMIAGISAVVALITMTVAVFLIADVANLKVIDEKIAMYTEGNAKIEAQIAEIVEQYQKYETDIFQSVKPESAMTVVALYPELKADALVQGQIEVYIDNNEKIKELRELKINGAVVRWWLYFGRADNG